MLQRVQRIVLVSVAAALLAVVSNGSPLVTPAFAATFNVYLAPSSSGGSDAHSGLSSSAPILTLSRAQQVIRAANPATDVVVDILQGNYTVGETDWSFYIPGHAITFMAHGYVPGGGRPAAGDPVFTNVTSNGVHPGAWWFRALLPSSTSEPLYSGGTTGLRFYYLRVRDYTGGISFDGQTGRTYLDNESPPMYIKPSLGIDGNTVFGMSFEQIGNKYTNATWGYAAILFTDSSNNNIDNNTFDQVENTTNPGAIHDLYITHFSSSNSVTRNTIRTVSSYAIKVRDRSNYNDVDGNSFNDTGGTSAYRDEFCDLACVQAHPGTPRQCASYGNSFNNNVIGTVYGGTSKQGVWSMSPPGQTYAGGSGCSIPSGLQRLTTSGNT
jgi:Periplasmic copper-binding protein (NosD)